MPARRFKISAPAVRRTEPAYSRRKIDLILSERERIVSELLRLREQQGSSKLIENAQQLLTRWWASASWKAREELLKSANWLLRVEKRQDDVTQT